MFLNNDVNKTAHFHNFHVNCIAWAGNAADKSKVSV